jgi:hypothetical protein
MAIVVKHQTAAAQSPALKNGTYKAMLTNIKQFANTYGQRLGFEFTVTSGECEGEKVMRSTAPQLTKQSKLAEVIEGMLGRDLTDKEIKDGFDLELLLNKECSILVIQSKSKTGVTYSNVEQVFLT